MVGLGLIVVESFGLLASGKSGDEGAADWLEAEGTIDAKRCEDKNIFVWRGVALVVIG